MKLLSKKEARNRVEKENEELLEKNVRLREFHKKAIRYLNDVKEDYSDDKIKRLRDFEQFCADLQQKKHKLLIELEAVEDLIKEKKDLFYGLIEKQDALEEKIFQLQEKERKLDLRENFVEQVEEAIKEKTNANLHIQA